MRKLPLILILLLCTILGVALMARDQAGTFTSRMVGKTPENFSLPVLGESDRNGGPEQWKGHVTIVNVFASWCTACVIEHPVLLELKKKSGVPIVGIVWRDKPETILDFFLKHGNPFETVLLDETGISTTRLALSGVPETFVIGKDGRIAYNRKMGLTEDEVNNVLLPLVEKLKHE